MLWINNLFGYFVLHPIQLAILLLLISFSKSTAFLSPILPPASIMLLAGISAGISILPTWTIWLAITIGSTAGSILSFYLGRSFVHTKVLNRLIEKDKTRFLYIQNKLQSNVILVVFTSRFVAVLRYLVPLICGMIFLCPIKFYLISIFSSAIWSALYVSGFHVFLSKIL